MKILLPLALAAAALSAVPAGALSIRISDDGHYRISVPYGDLDLASPAGVRSLEGRLKAAANALCGSTAGMGFGDARAIGSCRRTVRDAARPQMKLALNKGKGRIALAGSR